jgi:hypothetical protein
MKKLIAALIARNADTSMSLHIKWINGAVRVFAFKNSWRIPAGTRVPIILGFDKDSWGSTTASGGTDHFSPTYTAGVVEFAIAPASLKSFLNEFSLANKMWLRFTSGNETPWVANMNGSGAAVESFKTGVRNMLARGKGTQPFSSQATQPFSNQATQPFSTSPVTRKAVPGEESF